MPSPALDYMDLAFLVRVLGRTATAKLSGAQSRRTVEDWLSGRGNPSDDQVTRLNFACDLFRELSQFQGENNTTHWFLAPSVSTTGKKPQSPVEAISEDYFDEVRTIANATMA
jgi:hypothetical protein